MDRSQVIERLKLVRNMEKNGTPGEQNAARHLLGKLKRKYHVRESDLLEIEQKGREHISGTEFHSWASALCRRKDG